MTDEGQKVERREIADTLVRALERRHELLDVIVESEDYDAAVEAIATMLGTSTAGGEAVLRLSFDRLTKVSRRRIRDELEDLNHELSFIGGGATVGAGKQPARCARSLPTRTATSSPRAPTTYGAAGDGSGAPAGDLDDEISAAVGRVHAEEAVWLVALDGSDKIGMVFGELASGEVNVRIWIHPAFRKQGYGTAALRKSRSEMAAYFPAVPLVVRAPAAGA